MPGYNTSQESLVLRAYAHQVNPDHVILGFFPGNDVIPNALTFIDEEGNIASHHEMIQRAKKNLRRSFSLLFHSIVFRILAVSTYVPKVRYEIATRGEIIRRSYALLKELKRETQSLGSWLSVVIIHPRDSVSGCLVQAWSKSREVGYMIRDFCHKNNIKVIDMLDYMHGHGAKRKYFYQKDGHFNKEGNYLVSRTIFQKCLRDRTILRNKESVE
jgi:hypothetical protein